MYDITCPYCGEDDNPFEVEGCINCYVPHLCEHCKKFYYILQRSWFDPFYDNHKVEVRDEIWVKENRRKLKKSGTFDDGEYKANIYRPRFDIYKESGGRKYAESVIKKLFKLT